MAREIDREQLAWAAGLYEGEGSVGAYLYKNRPTLLTPQVRMRLSSTDEDVARRFYEIVGVGYFYGPLKVQQGRYKDRWDWVSGKWVEAQYVAGLFWPWLGGRRKEQFVKALRAHHQAYVDDDSYRLRYRKTLAFQWFGKRMIELTEDERKDYRRRAKQRRLELQEV
jgi:hypothetical protein